MKALGRVFAGELAKTTLQITGKNHLSPVLVTPGGAAFTGIFLIGALTRINLLAGDFLEVWVADPTGMFLLIPGRQDTVIREALLTMEPPVFIAVSGEVQPLRTKSATAVTIRPVDIRTANRMLRDSWIIRTAEITLERLCRMKSVLNGTNRGETAASGYLLQAIRHYHSDTDQINELETMVRNALVKAGKVRGGEMKAPDPREVILELIRAGSGTKGIALTDLTTLAVQKGIRDDQVLAVVRQLVLEDECYQPGAGIVKLL
ncbi:MAG TPA: hypothetical protein VMS89_01765 [Methanoregulaceae archaeon]|nr:hypothetical protein [Methanoregulaceae archaeon]